MAEHMKAELVTDALNMAVHRRRPAAGLIHHSDQGWHTYLWTSARQPVTPGSRSRWAPVETAGITPSPRASSRR
jgi:transposase InsO family protein